MSSREDSLWAAIRRWDGLSVAEQYAAVRECAHALTRNWPPFFDEHVVGLGFGARQKGVPGRGRSGSNTRLLHDCPTLVVLVDEKLSPSQIAERQDVRPVPDRIEAVVTVRGRKLVVAVPTDVVRKSRTPRAQAVEGLLMTNTQGLGLKGSVAAIVRDMPESGGRYFLTCHHVACLSVFDPNLEALTPAEAALLPDGSVIGTTVREAWFGQGIGPCVDAALVRIDPDDAANEDLSLPIPLTGYVTSIEQFHEERASGMALFSLHKPNGVLVEFQRMRVDLEVSYQTGAVATIVEAMEYQLPWPGTRNGDSGGALVSANGVFLGMHIAGDGTTGFGIPAWMLLESPAFDPMITLA